MPFPFSLPTTSNLSLQVFFSSSTHPSLPHTATVQRSVLRAALKRHKRLSPQQRSAHLTEILTAVQEYIPYLFVLDAALRGEENSPEHVEVTLEREVSVQWRVTLSAATPGRRDPTRVSVKGLDAEISFVLLTLAEVHSLLARVQLRNLYDRSSEGGAPSSEQRAKDVAAAMNHLLQAHSVCSYLVERVHNDPSSVQVPADISPSVLSALTSLLFAEATLAVVVKDDPYAEVVARGRHKQDNEWMYAAPKLPKVRAHLFARLCLKAEEHASRGAALLSGVSAQGAHVESDSSKIWSKVPSSSSQAIKPDERIAKYLQDLQRAAKGKACRFLGIDADAEGKTATGIAWLKAAKQELGLESTEGKEANIVNNLGLRKLKKDWRERREDQRVEKGQEWGADAGKMEEVRICDYLLSEWNKFNDMAGAQPIPAPSSLLSGLPSGREYHTSRPYQRPWLREDVMVRMRAPPDSNAHRPDYGDGSNDSESSDDSEVNDDEYAKNPGNKKAASRQRAEKASSKALPGAFPGAFPGAYATDNQKDPASRVGQVHDASSGVYF